MQTMTTAIVALLLGAGAAAGCGGGGKTTSIDLAAIDGATTLADLAMSGDDLANVACSDPTTGIYVQDAMTSIVLVSVDPNAWDQGVSTQVVTSGGTALQIFGIVVDAGVIYFRGGDGHLYKASSGDIHDGKLVATDQGAMASPMGSLYRIGGNAGALSATYGNGLLGPVAENGIVTASTAAQLPATCGLVDWQGTVAADHYAITALCYDGVYTISSSGYTDSHMAMTSKALPGLLGMQNFGAEAYFMDSSGNLYDSALTIVKTTKRCTPGDSTTNGKAIAVLSL